MVEIDDPGSPFYGRIGKVIYTDHEALRVDVAPKWYWGEGDVREAMWESQTSLMALPMGTIVEDKTGVEWVKIGSDIWATTQLGSNGSTLTGVESLNLAGRYVKRTFLGKLD
jgi:hypothetical protein